MNSADHAPASHPGNSLNGLRHVLAVFVLVFMAACAATDRPRSPLSDARISGEALRPALDRLLSPGEVQVAEGHLRDFGYDPGPVDGRFTTQTQAAVRAFQARYGLRVSGPLDRQTRQELLPGLDQDEFDP
jgi:peptidoglycan hydrolase-like protein with peptidoglycan-binding domain